MEEQSGQLQERGLFQGGARGVWGLKVEGGGAGTRHNDKNANFVQPAQIKPHFFWPIKLS